MTVAEISEQEAILELTQYTDPYCTWCWGTEPILRRIQETYGHQVRQRFVVGGLVEDMRKFFDAANNIGGAAWYIAVAGHWEEASSQHGMPVDGQVFYDQKNEVFSTYPACIAFKAAQFQGEDLAQRYLRRLREAAAAERLIIQQLEVQVRLAEEVGLNPTAFRSDILEGRAEEAFRADLRECRSAGVRAFPTFLIRKLASGDSVRLDGYRPFESFARAFRQLADTELREAPVRADDSSIHDFVRRYGKVAAREVSEVLLLPERTTCDRLDAMVAAGLIERHPAGNGFFYASVG